MVLLGILPEAFCIGINKRVVRAGYGRAGMEDSRRLEVGNLCQYHRLGSLRLSSHESGGAVDRVQDREGMSDSPFGRCPICTQELVLERELLRCPAGDYAADARQFSERWEAYLEEANNPPPSYDALAASEELLADLQKMNVKEITRYKKGDL